MLQETSDRHAGKHDVTVEIKSDLNDRLILHDSEGFGFGEINTLRTVQDFIKKRSSKSIPLNDRLHAIWHVKILILISALALKRCYSLF
jgi:hypothetical protein